LKKSKDLLQVFEKLKTKMAEFENENIVDGMDRVEIEGVIQQVSRLHDKLEKFRNIVSKNYKY